MNYKIERPLFHPTPKKGWINDPNGFSFYQGHYHLFAQYNPFEPKWGPMHWLHFLSPDLVHWKEVGIALQPEHPYELPWGCFSGTAIQDEDQLLLYYTGAQEGAQVQCLASSLDGETFVKYPGNPILDGTSLPAGYSLKDFRDPKIVKQKGRYYLFTGVKKPGLGSSILCFDSPDGIRFSFLSTFYEGIDEVDGCLECPDLLLIDEHHAILSFSPQNKPSHGQGTFQNKQSSVYVYGELDLPSGWFRPLTPETEFDQGFDFYAPELLRHGDHCYLAGWAANWGRNYPMAKDGYANSLLIREISYQDNRLLQSFVNRLDLWWNDSRTYRDIFARPRMGFGEFGGSTKRIRFTIESKSSFTICVQGGYIISHEFGSPYLTIRRTNQAYETMLPGQEKDDTRYVKVGDYYHYHFDIFIDGYLIETIINHGEFALTSQYFSKGDNSLIFEGDAKVTGLRLDYLTDCQ